MKALSLWQPWASYIAYEMKRYETRSWGTPYRGLLAIHAAKRPLGEGELELLEEIPLPFPVAEMPFGALVAICDLTDVRCMTDAIIASRDCQELELGDWYPGRFAWRLTNVSRLAVPLPIRGAQGLWDTGLPSPADMPGMEEVQR